MNQSLDDNRQCTFRMKKTTYYLRNWVRDRFLNLEYFKFTPSIRGVFAIMMKLIRDNDPIALDRQY